jgi:hypothetical protein
MKRLYEGSDVTELRSMFEEKPEAEKEVITPAEQTETEAEKVCAPDDEDAAPAVAESGASTQN